MTRILVLTALLFTAAAAQSTPACANTCLSTVATQEGCSGPTDAACLCTLDVLGRTAVCLTQTCAAGDLDAAGQAVDAFCQDGAGSSGSAAPSGSQSPSGGSGASASTTGSGHAASASQSASAMSSAPSTTSASNSATTASSAPSSPSPSQTTSAATRASACSGALGVIVVALGASLLL